MSLDEDHWGPARRELRRRVAALTRRYPAPGHDSFVNVHATYLSDALVHAEARAWVTSLALRRDEYAHRVEGHLRPGRLSFVVELVNHRFAWVQANTDRILRAARLEVDGRFFPVESVERAFFPALDEGTTRVIHFRDPEGEHALPGPSARRVRLWFPGLPHRKTVARRARFGRPEAATIPRISFPPEMFGRRWEHDLRLPKKGAEPPERLEDPDEGRLPPLRRTRMPNGWDR